MAECLSLKLRAHELLRDVPLYVHYDGDLKLDGYGVLADFFPLKGRFRVTGGALSNRNRIDLNAAPT